MSVVDEIKERLDIVDLVGSYVALKKAGQNYKGLCPFHTERTPSFVVFPDSQSWHCFGACSTGGDIFSFVMRQENLDFPEALALLADRAGVELHPLDDEEILAKDERDRLRALNALAAQFYHRVLMESPAGARAKEYLLERGVEQATMRTFMLGYAPDEWHALHEHLRNERQDEGDALTAGLLSRSDSGNIYDRFRGRVMFPIHDIGGYVIGFGGRVLGEGTPKYLNTPQTPLFDKSSILYGIDLARQAIRSSETAILVEGYMDMIVPYQCGVQNVVAVMGTALTEAHIRILKRVAKKLVFALDPDAAGIHAVEKGVEVAREHLDHKVAPIPLASGMVHYEEQLDGEIRVLALPDGLDPDELILQNRDLWDQLVANAQPVVDFFFDIAMQNVDLNTAKSKRAVVDRLAPVIAAIDNRVERTHYVQRLARTVRLDEQIILPLIGELRGEQPAARGSQRRRRSVPVQPEPADTPGADVLTTEEHCLALLLMYPSLTMPLVDMVGFTETDFQDVRNRQVFLQIVDAPPPDEEPEEYVAELDTALRAHVESVLHRCRARPPLEPEDIRKDFVKRAGSLHIGYLDRSTKEYEYLLQDALETSSQQLSESVRQWLSAIDALRCERRRVDKQIDAVTMDGQQKQRH